MRTLLAVLVLAVAGCGSSRAASPPDATSADAAAGAGSTTAAAEATCLAAAQEWGGTPAASHPMTVAEVRAYMEDRHGSSQDPTAPRPGPQQYPAGWDGLLEDTPAAACYLDGPVPKGPPPRSDGTVQPSFDRRLVMATQSAPSFMVSAGYRDNFPAEPLVRYSTG